jgi:hypothetical protein
VYGIGVEKKTIQIRSFPTDLLQRIKVEMVKRGQTLGEFVAMAVREFLRK